MTSQFQNLKNFIRHGKQARHHDPPAASRKSHAFSDPAPGTTGVLHQQPKHDFSMNVVDNRNIASPTSSTTESTPQNAADGVAAAGAKGGKGYDQETLAKIIAEEKVNREKLPRYPGLDRWILSAKMGDGAFSNVYRARDSQGVYGEVAIKVVRKYELNASQVCMTVFFFFLCRFSFVRHLLLWTRLANFFNMRVRIMVLG
jgi:hypothetical protein